MVIICSVLVVQLFFASQIDFFFFFFSASALFIPFSLFFLSEAFFYFLLYSETPQWDVSTSLHHIQTTKDNIEQLLFCSIVPCCLLLSYVVWFFNANYHELSMNYGAHQFMDNYMVIICSVIVMQLFFTSLINFSTFFQRFSAFYPFLVLFLKRSVFLFFVHSYVLPNKNRCSMLFYVVWIIG